MVFIALERKYNMITVSELSGTAWVRDESGELRALQEGDRIPVDAEVITAPGASISLQADGMPSFTVGGDREITLDPSLFDDAEGLDATESSVPTLANSEDERILATLDAGVYPCEELDHTAGVLGGGGGADGGSSFLRLLDHLETTSPLALAYPRPGIETDPIYYQPGEDIAGAANPLIDDEGGQPINPEEEIIDDGDADADADADAGVGVDDDVDDGADVGAGADVDADVYASIEACGT